MASDKEKAVIYYSDGYHGGLKGHMPFGCWTDILHVFHQIREWKISIEVEPVSWEDIKVREPDTYKALRDDLFARKNQDRVEMVAGSYAQPYCWNIGGESNIRQLVYGIRLNKSHFPDVVIDTYAVQEPCWTSSLPQILRSLGFRRSTLKNPGTAWAGYSRGFDREIVNWVGPDGTSIPCVPRYACEGLSGAWATECERMEPDFVEKCLKNGIAKPIGSQYQDLGWPAGPNLGIGLVTYVTWREYFDTLADAPTVPWHFSQEDILCTLPWGEKRLQRLSRDVRSAENTIVTAEKIAVIASILAGAPYPAGLFSQSWENLMMAQHHDAWICLTQREDRKNWGWVAGAQTWLVEENCDKIISGSLLRMRENDESAYESKPGCDSLSPGLYAEPDGRGDSGCSMPRYINVFNTLGFLREDAVCMEIPMLENCRTLLLRDSDGHAVPFQMSVLRVSDDGMIDAVSLTFVARVPGMGISSYSVEFLQEKSMTGEVQDPAGTVCGAEAQDPVSAAYADESTLLLHSDIYDIVLDLNRGGIFTRLFHKRLKKDFCPNDGPYFFHEYRGYFAKIERSMSSADFKATASILENGPIRVVVAVNGGIAGNRLVSTITLVKGHELIDIVTRAEFEGEQWIGDPCEISAENAETERTRSHHDSFRNLHAVFPFQSDARQICKNAAFDVCRSRLEDTRFTSWDQIKHNIILNWIDIHDETTGAGLALLSDHTTSYGHSPDYPVHLTFAWSGNAGLSWGKCPLSGHQEMKYAILPHQGDWEQSLTSRFSCAWNEPLITRLSRYPSGNAGLSLFEVTDPHVEITAAYVENGKVLVRLFHAGTEKRAFVLRLGFVPEKIEWVELDGRLTAELVTTPGAYGLPGISMEMQPFGIRTLSFTVADPIDAASTSLR